MTTADPIVPDGKDWTWVLQRPCAECGFDTATIAGGDVAGMLATNARAWTEVLRRDDVRARPKPDVWSPLEYACHVRDVYELYDYRLHLMLDSDDPVFPNWDQDQTALSERYGEQDPATVASELTAAQQQLSASFAAVEQDQWQRTGNRSDGARFTIDGFARYLIHDPIHHLFDVGYHPVF
jgi:hypothetical protein